MNRNENAEKDPEILSLEGLLSDMEADSAHVDYTVPEDWDRDFRKAIRQGLRNQRNKMQKSRMKRKLRLTGIAAMMMILLSVDGLVVQEVQAKGLLKIFQFIFDLGNDKHVAYGTDENMSMDFEDEEKGDIFFEGESLDEIFGQIRSEMKMPIIHVDDVFEEYEINEAKYNIEFNMINIELETLQGKIYISQQVFSNNNGSGILSDGEECAEIYNENLKRDIIIYRCKSEDGYSFSIENGILYFSIVGNMSLRGSKQIAESLYCE